MPKTDDPSPGIQNNIMLGDTNAASHDRGNVLQTEAN